ncbi:DUF262 domain-containing protein [Bradyrhizobium sp. SZCCHNR2032]|uniref:GmrSD restriction endonuclease domain-containing protein n=1 Tax=Bradyrhizobium sp. SZCCHNR2032 TaxID=3057384 RepID=UPI0029169187|nr:DUF262 domain-containing protein [Bradyrhizobium sp. SZCCHNR2032]
MEQVNLALALPVPTHSRYTTLLSDIEKGEIKIPQFQRDFVWSIQKSAALIDSVIKAYPIGTFIFWDTKERLRSVRDLGNVRLPEPKDGDVVSFVLGGQQRLTSLFAVLKGLKIGRDAGSVEDFSEVYVDLKANPDEQIVITDLTEKDAAACIKLSDLLQGGLKKLSAYPEEFHPKLDEYKERIQSYDFAIIRVRDVPIEVATEIFTRINVGGKPLSLFEIMVAKTYDEKRKFDLSEAFDDLITSLTPVDYETISDATILQLVSLVLAGDCKKQAILKLGKKDFIDVWPKAVDAIERAVEYFRDTYRIPVSQLLPYNTLLVPFGYYFYHHPDKPDVPQRGLLEDFFWRCSLGGRYSSAVESKLVQDMKRIDLILKDQSPDYDWPINASPDFLIGNGWFNAGRSFVKAILCLYAYHEPKSFNDNAKVNIQNNWLKQSNSKNYHHFFPRAYLAKEGVEEARINNVLNITIVDDYLNKRKIRARPPSDYMTEFRQGNSALAATMKTHLIDDLDGFGVWHDDYDQFVRARAEAVSAEFGKRIIPREVDKQNQAARTDDFEEEMSTFE